MSTLLYESQNAISYSNHHSDVGLPRFTRFDTTPTPSVGRPSQGLGCLSTTWGPGETRKWRVLSTLLLPFTASSTLKGLLFAWLCQPWHPRTSRRVKVTEVCFGELIQSYKREGLLPPFVSDLGSSVPRNFVCTSTCIVYETS